MKKKVAILAIFTSLLLSSCVAAPCTLQNNEKFIAEIKEVGYSFDAIEFNVAYSLQVKADRLQKIRDRAKNINAPGCAQYLKDLLLLAFDERAKDIGNPSNAPRPVTASFQAEFEAFQKASIAQLTNVATDPSNSTIVIQILILLVGLIVVLLLGFGGYFIFHSERH